MFFHKTTVVLVGLSILAGFLRRPAEVDGMLVELNVGDKAARLVTAAWDSILTFACVKPQDISNFSLFNSSNKPSCIQRVIVTCPASFVVANWCKEA